VSEKQENEERRVLGFLGVAFDNEDGHQRITRSEHFILVGGSDSTHGHMQETAIKFSEALRQTGKTLKQTTLEQVIELFHDTGE
jgi:hypothetical protein